MEQWARRLYDAKRGKKSNDFDHVDWNTAGHFERQEIRDELTGVIQEYIDLEYALACQRALSREPT